MGLRRWRGRSRGDRVRPRERYQSDAHAINDDDQPVNLRDERSDPVDIETWRIQATARDCSQLEHEAIRQGIQIFAPRRVSGDEIPRALP
jgi:hypothetical protein